MHEWKTVLWIGIYEDHGVGMAAKESCDNSSEWLATSAFPDVMLIDYEQAPLTARVSCF